MTIRPPANETTPDDSIYLHTLPHLNFYPSPCISYGSAFARHPLITYTLYRDTIDDSLDVEGERERVINKKTNENVS